VAQQAGRLSSSPLARRTTVFTLLVVLLSTSLHAQVPAPSGPVPAIWRTQHIDFRFRSERVRYRCEEFAVRLARILNVLGARLDAGTELRCVDSFSGAVTGRIAVTGPVEATSTNVERALADITSIDELVARVNGLPDPKTRNRVFAAEWRLVSPTKSQLHATDCDLLRAVARQVFPTLQLRDIDVSASCMSNNVPRFRAIALVRVDGVSVDDEATQSPAVTADAQCDPAISCESPDTEDDATVTPAG
jgi:hypothetical protein